MTASIATVCIHCGGTDADAQTGRCLSCGKLIVSPSIAAEFGHPTLGQNRHSPSASYRNLVDRPPAASASQEPPPSIEPLAEPTPITPEVVKRAAAWALAPESRSLSGVAFRLPDSPATTKWIRETRALRDKLLAQAERADAQVAELTTQAAHNRESAQAFSTLLEAIAIGEAPAVTASAASTTTAVPALTSVSTAQKPRGKWSKHADACIDCHRSDVPHVALDRCRNCYHAKYERDRRNGSA